jgi:hypothetical protein
MPRAAFICICVSHSSSAISSLLPFRPYALQPRIQPSSVRFKADHLVNNNTSFQCTCRRGRPDARAIFQHTSRSALQARDHSNAFSPYTRRAFLLHSAQARSCVQPHYTTDIMSRSSRSHSRSAALLYRHYVDDATCQQRQLTSLVFSPHTLYGCPFDSTAHYQVSTIILWTVLHDVNLSCPIVMTVAPLLFSFLHTIIWFHPSRMSCGFYLSRFFPTLALKP